MSENILKNLRNNVGISGLVSTIMGLLILFWPGRTAQIGTVVVGAGFILIGISYLVSTFSLKDEEAWSRFGHLLLGVVYLIAGIFSLINSWRAPALASAKISSYYHDLSHVL